jgi:glycosyltransferase involved in cell wall biosynthesis
MGPNPLISVIMSVNRDDGNLTETINSILNQTYQNYELIMSDIQSRIIIIVG